MNFTIQKQAYTNLVTVSPQIGNVYHLHNIFENWKWQLNIYILYVKSVDS